MPAESEASACRAAGTDGKLPFGAALRTVAARDPEKVAITQIGSDGTASDITWSELERQSNRLARSFESRGVSYGSFVSIALPNGIDFLMACVAAWKCGAVPQPLSYQLPPRERQEVLDLVKPGRVPADRA